MSNRLVVLASYETPVEADFVKNLLETEGIRATIADEAITGWVWMFNNAVGGAKVLVWENDVPRARQVLAEHEAHRLEDEEQEDPDGPWVCPQCEEELSEEFEMCWSCGTPYPGPWARRSQAFSPNLPPALPESAIADPAAIWACEHCQTQVPEEDLRCPECGTTRDGVINPYFTRADVSGLSSGSTSESDWAERTLARAWRAAVLGLLFPPLHLYAFWLLFSVALRNPPLSPTANRRFYSALLISLIGSGLVGILLISMW